jgi:hypothetical protein
MLTNIQSLFADILQTPQQRALQMRNEGVTRAELATRNLSGGGQLLAPLISAQAQNAPMIEDMIRRGFGGLFGQDTRTESERIQGMLSEADTATPEGQQALLTAMRNQGYGVQAAQYQQMMLAQQQADEDRQLERDLATSRLSTEGLQQELAGINIEAANQNITLNDLQITEAERAAAAQEVATKAREAQQTALSTWLQAKGNEDLSRLAAEGVITASNFTDFLDDDNTTVLNEGDVLVRNDNGRTIASNPKTGTQVTRDYSLTAPEIETYETLIEENEDIKGAFQTPRRFWLPSATNENKIRILIDEAERIRTQNPEISKETALRQALAQSESQPVVAAPAEEQPAAVSITTEEEYNSLPRGARFTTPDGVTRVKQ